MPTALASSPPRVTAPVSRRCDARRRAGAAVAPRVHRGGEQQRALEGVLEHRQRHRRHRPDAAAGVAAQLPGPAHPLHALGQLRRHRHRDDDGRADLVQRGRAATRSSRLGLARALAAPMQAMITASRRPEHGRADQPLEVDRATELDAGRPRRQRHLGQVEQHDLAELEPDEHVQHDPHDDDDQPEPQVEPEGPRPRRGARAGSPRRARRRPGRAAAGAGCWSC